MSISGKLSKSSLSPAAVTLLIEYFLQTNTKETSPELSNINLVKLALDTSNINHEGGLYSTKENNGISCEDPFLPEENGECDQK